MGSLVEELRRREAAARVEADRLPRSDEFYPAKAQWVNSSRKTTIATSTITPKAVRLSL